MAGCTTTLFESQMEFAGKMKTSPSPESIDSLTFEAKHKVFDNVLAAVDKKFYKPDLLGEAWRNAVVDHRQAQGDC